MTARANAAVIEGRAAIRSIIHQVDSRLLIVLGPCSIHDPIAALDYAHRLVKIGDLVGDQFCLAMRLYFEKPRTTVGWKGLINDPHLDGTFAIEEGLSIARKFLIEVNEMGIPAATEFLDPIVPQYLADLISWAAIGARTTESQTHREMASGLSMPVGFKNGTDGSPQIALDAMLSVRHPHRFLGIDQHGVVSIFQTTGNADSHIILRGGRSCSNYDSGSISMALDSLKNANLPRVVMVDCSHANSCKQFQRQEQIWRELLDLRIRGWDAVIGLMLESHLAEGNQGILQDVEDLRYGVSITDACIGWEATERLLLHGAELLRNSRCRN